MSLAFPYSYVSCPCSHLSSSRGVQEVEGDDDERTFDPRSARANYSLYPPEHLLYCEDCHEIRCPRCTLEEIVCWYCPSCLFEVPSSLVKSEGNRCTRNCFNCPICTAPLAVNTLESETGGAQGQWILTCGYCNWTSLDISIRLEKPNNIHSQLAKIKSKRNATKAVDSSTPDPDARFAALKSFYTAQLSSSSPTNPLLSSPSDYNYSSPSSLARIMNLYTSSLSTGKPPPPKPTPMREALLQSEGLHLPSPNSSASTIQTLLTHSWESTTTPSQRSSQPHSPCFTTDLHPVPALLRTKRSKRCRTCRHILVKPEAKVQSTRYRIRLVAVNYIPSITLTPLSAGPAPTTTTFSFSTTTTTTTPPLDLTALPPLQPLQFVLTLRNPMFDPVKVSLATPSRTPGRQGHKVTILCPEFEMGASADVWDEALQGAAGQKKEHGGSGGNSNSKGGKGGGDEDGGEGKGKEKEKEAEAGKVWERGRNWTSVVLEVVCREVGGGDGNEGEGEDEDADVLEIPVFVRVEYEVEVAGEEGGGGSGGGEKERMEKRELAYWCVLGVGRVARLGG